MSIPQINRGMNYKEISEILPLNLFDIYESWSKIDNELEQSETGRIAKKVLDDAGNQIGRILLEAAEDVLESISDKVIEEVKEVVEDVTEFIKGDDDATN